MNYFNSLQGAHAVPVLQRVFRLYMFENEEVILKAFDFLIDFILFKLCVNTTYYLYRHWPRKI